MDTAHRLSLLLEEVCRYEWCCSPMRSASPFITFTGGAPPPLAIAIYWLCAVLTTTGSCTCRWSRLSGVALKHSYVGAASFDDMLWSRAVLLQLCSDVTGLCTNFHKSSVVPIRCANLDLVSILSSIPATRASFPIKCLGLPLSVWRLKKVDFQYLQDKAAGKLVTWDG